MVGLKIEGFLKAEKSQHPPRFLSFCFPVIRSTRLALPGVGSTRAAVISLQDFPGPGNSGFAGNSICIDSNPCHQPESTAGRIGRVLSRDVSCPTHSS